MKILSSCEFEELEEEKEYDLKTVMMPSFTLQIDNAIHQNLNGVKINGEHQITSTKQSLQIEIAKGLANRFDMRDEENEKKALRIDDDFMFVLFDDENNHLILAAQISKSDFIKYPQS